MSFWMVGLLAGIPHQAELFSSNGWNCDVKDPVEEQDWYGNSSPNLGKSFTAQKTAERHSDVLDILLRAANHSKSTGNRKQADVYFDLYDKLEACRQKRRCASSACPVCARAFQRAKTAAQLKAIKRLAKTRSTKHLVLVTLIPKRFVYKPGQFFQLDIPKANRWLKDTLKRLGINRVILGSADLSWENRRGGKYLQLHWHLAMWTSNVDALKRKLRLAFKRVEKYERPVDVRQTIDLKFIRYINKVTKLPELLRHARKQLPELLVVLDKAEPLDLLVHTKLQISAQEHAFALLQNCER